MNHADFAVFSRVLKERSGLVLTESRAYLLESRLIPVAKKYGFDTVARLAGALRGACAPDLVRAVVEAMTTNETFFFRDVKPFEQFRAIILPALMKARAKTRTIRIWSAACAAGQEPYSLAMILAEASAMLAGWQVDLLATDISQEMVTRARAGRYTQFEVQRGLSIGHLVRHFEPDGDMWQLKPAIRAMVQFRTANLLEDFAAVGRMDAIFCRNVLIYFDPPTKTQILERLARQLPADGFLVLGGAETTLGVSKRFEPVAGERGLYRPAGSPALASA